MKLLGKLTLRYFFLIRCFSSLKLLEISSTLCKSPRIAFHLWFCGTADDYLLGILDSFTKTDVTIFNHNFRIQVFARIYLYCQLYIEVIII